MATFSSRDIEEAKRRVREMHSRAESYVSQGRDNQRITENSEKQNMNMPPESNKTEHKKEKSVNEEKNIDDSLFSGDSSFIILVLLMLLSHEGADNKLLLALLYLLL